MHYYLLPVLVLIALLLTGCDSNVESSMESIDSTLDVAIVTSFTEAIITPSTEIFVEESNEVTIEETTEETFEETLIEVVPSTEVTTLVDESLSTEPSITESTMSTSVTPDTSVLWGDNTVGEYYVEGYGTVYGFFVDTSEFNNQVQNHLIEIGLSPYSSCNSTESVRTRAVECTVLFSHQRPNGQYPDVNEIITTASANGAFEAFRNSPGHWAHIEAGPDAEFTNLSSASFTRLGWYEDGTGGYCWQIEACSTVAQI